MRCMRSGSILPCEKVSNGRQSVMSKRDESRVAKAQGLRFNKCHDLVDFGICEGYASADN